VPRVLCEGRGALATCFQLFRFMALYSMIQFGCCIMLYFKGSNLGDSQFLNQDMFLVFPLVVLMGETYAADTLTVDRPSSDLLSVSNLFSVAAHVFICLGFQLYTYLSCALQPGYEALPNDNFLAHSWHVTSLYLLGNFQYVLVAALFSSGSVWKKPLAANRRLFCWLIFAAGFCLFLLFGTDATLWPMSALASKATWSETFFLTRDDVPITTAWRFKILWFFLLNCLASTALEFVIMPRFDVWLGRLQNRRYTNTEYGPGGTPADGSKPYHIWRREIEDGWYLNAAPSVTAVPLEASRGYGSA
jgi:cation-transporting ATPase 13A3/4/5